jgi:hypothetical protein
LRYLALVSLLLAGSITALAATGCGEDCKCDQAGDYCTDAGYDGDAAQGDSGASVGSGGSTTVTLPSGCWDGFKQCDPLDETSCGTDGSTCDYGTNQTGSSGLFCFGPPNTKRLGEQCSNLTDGPFCAPTLHCAGVPGRCAKMCCSKADCNADETCDPIDREGGTLGTCQPEAAGSAGSAATGGSAGSAAAGAAGRPTAGEGGSAGVGGFAGSEAGGTAGAAGAAGAAGGPSVTAGASGMGAAAGSAGAAGAAGVAGLAGAAGSAGMAPSAGAAGAAGTAGTAGFAGAGGDAGAGGAASPGGAAGAAGAGSWP